MRTGETRNTPLLAGWTIATGLALVVFGVSLVVIGLDGNGAVAVAAVVWLVAGIILGLSRRDLPPPQSVASSVSRNVPAAAMAPTPVASTQSAPGTAKVAPTPAQLSYGARPVRMSEPRAGGPDDLKQIKGIGPALEAQLHGLGFFHYDQVAAWTQAEVDWVDNNVEGVRGRASRDNWVAQARALTATSDATGEN